MLVIGNMTNIKLGNYTFANMVSDFSEISYRQITILEIRFPIKMKEILYGSYVIACSGIDVNLHIYSCKGN